MRKLLISLLLAGAAASPALAAPNDDSDQPARAEQREAHEQTRAERRQSREEARPQRSERAVEFRTRSTDGSANAGGAAIAPRRDLEAIRAVRGSGRPQLESVEPARIDRVVRIDRDVEAARAARQARRSSNETMTPVRIDRVVRIDRRESSEVRDTTDTVRDWRADERQRISRRDGPKIVTPDEAGTLRQAERPLPHVLRNRVPIVSNTPREGTQPPLRAERRRHERVSWSSHWRHDRRYDWHHWRSRHRSLFRLGLYIDPFGWNYRPYSIGWRLWPSYYSSRFWLDDPWMYRLPYAPPGYRWIRYYDDAILIDTWDGRVIDVIYNFFW